MLDNFYKKVIQLGRLKGQAQRMQKASRKEKRHIIMEKTTLKKIIRAVRDLEVKKSKNDSQFEFYNKKKRRIEYKERKLINESMDYWYNNKYDDETEKTELEEKFKKLRNDKINCIKQNKKALNFYYGFMDKLENENKIINNQIKQYLTNYVLITLVDKLNKSKTFNYKKLDRIFDQIKKEANKIHESYWCYMYIEEDYYNYLVLKFTNYSDKIYIKCDFKKYLESHLTKKTITKKFSIDDFKDFIKWDIKTPEQEAQDNATTENELNELKSKIEKLISDYNQERQKLTINQDNYKYMYVRQS